MGSARFSSPVGDALAQFMPPGWFGEHVVPFIKTFEAVRVTQPLV